MLPIPTPETIKELHKTLDLDWGTLHEQDKRMLSYFDLTYDVPYPEPDVDNFEVQIIRGGWSRHAIKEHKAMFSSKPVFTHGSGRSITAHHLSESIEKFLNTLPWAIEAEYGPFWDPILEDVFKLGRGWCDVRPVRRRWVEDESYPQRGKGKMPDGMEVDPNETFDEYDGRLDRWKKDQLPPISIRHLPAEHVVAVLTERYHVVMAVRKVTVSLADAARRWPERFEKELNDKNNKPNEDVVLFEYVDQYWCAILAEFKSSSGFIGDPWPHDMGMCPWVLVEGLTTASSDPAKRWEPVLLNAEQVAVPMDSQLTRKNMITQLWPLPQPVIEDPDEAPDDVKKGREFLELKPPKALVLYGGKKFRIENWQGAEPEAENLWQKLERSMDRLLPDVGAEIAEGGTNTAAWTWRLRGQIAERDLKPVADNLSLSAKRIGQAVCRCVQSMWIHQKVYVRRKSGGGSEVIGIGPKELEGEVHSINATTKITNIVDRNSDIGAARLALQEPLSLPWRWVIENILRLENPQELRDEWFWEQIEMGPEYIQQLKMQVFQRSKILRQQQSEMPMDELAQIMPLLSPGAQAAIRRLQVEGVEGVGSSGLPEGAAPETIERTGVGTANQPGPKPQAETPGGAMPVPTGA